MLQKQTRDLQQNLLFSNSHDYKQTHYYKTKEGKPTRRKEQYLKNKEATQRALCTESWDCREEEKANFKLLIIPLQTTSYLPMPTHRDILYSA